MKVILFRMAEHFMELNQYSQHINLIQAMKEHKQQEAKPQQKIHVLNQQELLVPLEKVVMAEQIMLQTQNLEAEQVEAQVIMVDQVPLDFVTEQGPEEVVLHIYLVMPE